MKQKIFYVILSSLLLVSCGTFHKEESIEYVSSIMNENYDAVIEKTDESLLQDMDRESFITQLGYIRDSIRSYVSGEIEYKFGGGQKGFSNKPGEEKFYDYSTIVVTDNEKHMAVSLSYSPSGKVIDLGIGPVDSYPSMANLWIAGILLIAFVVLVIVLVKRNRRR